MVVFTTQHIDQERRFGGFTGNNLFFIGVFAIVGMTTISIPMSIPLGIAGFCFSQWFSHKNKNCYLMRLFYWHIPVHKSMTDPIPESFKRYFV